MKKKLVSLLALGMLAGSLASCTNSGNSGSASSASSAGGDESPVDIAMISDVGTINDNGFNQYTWEGTKAAADQLGKKAAYFVPTVSTDDERKAGIDAMLKRGAKAIVLTGYLFNSLVVDYAEKNPSVAWFLIDGSQDVTKSLKNVYSVEFKEQEAGYLAGYAVVKDGKYKKLGFMGGMAVPAVERFGFGYLKGICDAANEDNVDIEVNYGYTGDFTASEKTQQAASSWYAAGTQVIFSCGGQICNSIVAAAKKASTTAKLIGVDVNQHPQQTNDLYITSAEKKVEKTTKEALLTYFNQSTLNGQWPDDKASKHVILDSTTESVGLPTEKTGDDDPWTFTKFTKDAYKTIYDKLKADSNYTKVVSDNSSATTITMAEPLNNTHVTITMKKIGNSPIENLPSVTDSSKLK